MILNKRTRVISNLSQSTIYFTDGNSSAQFTVLQGNSSHYQGNRINPEGKPAKMRNW